ncbi:CPBP family intramembrane glutamic endopeptidase [Neomicrococcus aestuarii]|nr:type II CAAX endopeptidase family protein [Neomicrococcus aestuarii]
MHQNRTNSYGSQAQYMLPRRPKQPDFGPGKFVWGDFAAVALYALIFVVGGAALLLLVPGFREMFPSDNLAIFGVNLVVYAFMFTIAMLLARHDLWSSFKTFQWNPWAKVMLIPGGWFASLMLTATIISTLGEPVKSENQLAIEGLTTEVPFLTMFVVTAIMGPLVEEFIFRHLLIGKLSRYINKWVCALISIALFAGMHFIGSGTFEWVSVIPYLTLGTVITLAYILSGKSLAYSYVLHFFNNAVALIISYTVLPLMAS